MPPNNQQQSNPYALYSRDALEKEAQRNQKIIVALFLILGKAIAELPVKKRLIEVKESEIVKAWDEKKSPVRIMSEMRDNRFMEVAEELVAPNERVYWTVLQDLDLNKVGFMHHGQKCPPHEASAGSESNSLTVEKRRVFDLE